MKTKTNWQNLQLQDIGSIVAGGTPSTKNPNNFGGGVAWITPADLTGYTDKYISKGKRNLSKTGLKNSSAILLPKGSVLCSSRAPIGYVVIAENEIATNQGFKNVVPNTKIVNSEYLYYFLKGNKDLITSFASGTTFLEISAKRFSAIPIPVPPMAEQKRIVQKIEELFGVIDRDIQRLTDTLEQLSQFRQSVLQQAFSGKLYKTTNWLITTFGKSFISINPKIKIKTKNYLSNGDIPIIDQGEDFISGYWNNKNDAIQISKPVLCFGDHTRRFKYVDFNFVVGADGLKIFQPKDFEPKFGYYAALALKFPNKGYARHSVFLKKCKMYIPSLPEQQKIVDEIEKAFHAADQVQKAVQNALEQAKKLKQSILKKAFAGELVPQDPNDKPVNLPELKGQTK